MITTQNFADRQPKHMDIAAKFTLNGRVMMAVRVRGVGSEALLEIDVKDTGVGMSPLQTKRLFTPSAQPDSTSTRQFVGKELGLSISRRLARFMGGDVSLEWTEWDRGSRFRFVMPMTTTPQNRFIVVNYWTSARLGWIKAWRQVFFGRYLSD